MEPPEPLPGTIEVSIVRRPGAKGVSVRGLVPFVQSIAREAGAAAHEVTVVLVDDAEIQGLNRRYRGRDGATDVLSFHGDRDPAGRLNQGDIVVSVDTAMRQARQRHHPVETELRQLLIHGFLHLMGYDHETDGGEMKAEERRLRRALLVTGDRARTGARRRGRDATQ